MTENPDSLGAGLLLEDRLPLRWHALTVDAAEQQVLAHGNEETLRVILSLDDHHSESMEESELGPELLRIEMRLNLVLELVSQVLAQQLQLPRAVPVTLSARAARWRSTEPLAPGPGLLELYVSTRYPRPLQLPAVLAMGTAGQVEAEFSDLGPGAQELLERLIFRHHRRRIAATRRTPPTP
jgi:hypothetical protein